MRRAGLFDLVSLQLSLNQHGKHERILDYLARPRITLGSRNQDVINECTIHMEKRTPYDQLPNLGFASQDTTIFKKRFDLLATNNRAYQIAVKTNPSVEELEEFSFIEPGWSTLFPLKIYLMFHPKDAMQFRGMLPFGSEVIKFYNQSGMGEIKGTPNFRDHVRLMEMTNFLADHYGCSTATLNNEMYLEGQKITVA